MPTNTAVPSATFPQISTPRLVSPENGATFLGWNAKVILQWSSAGQLEQDEYYVVRIPYDNAGGIAEFWRKDTSIELPSHLSSGKVGFSDRHYNWSVQVMRCTSGCDKVMDDSVKKQGFAIGDQSVEGVFYWQPDIGPGTGEGDRPNATNTPPSDQKEQTQQR
jgi:hypothetical protein